MRTEEHLKAALRRPDAPWPDEVGSYDTVRVASGVLGFMPVSVSRGY
jgi:hypothetical protein